MEERAHRPEAVAAAVTLGQARQGCALEEEHVFLFQAGDELVLMHPKTYDQVEVRAEVLGEIQRRFLTDNCEVKLLMHEGEIVSAALADEVEIEIHRRRRL